MNRPLNIGLRPNRGVGVKRPPRGGGSGAAGCFASGMEVTG